MTIHVHYGGNLVGRLKGVPTDQVEIPILRMSSSIRKFGPDAGDIEDIIWINTEVRHLYIDPEKMQDFAKYRNEVHASDLRRIHDVPDYAEMSKRDDLILFTWRVASPTLSQYESIFDLDNFHPA